MRWLLFFTSLISLPITMVALADTKKIDFHDYVITERYVGKISHIKIISAEDKKYRAQLQIARGQEPNFAGHYFLLEFGCGASCIRSAAIDVKTGVVFWLPFTTCCFPSDIQHPIRYQLDSSLIEVRGSRNETGFGTYYYQFTGDQFVLIKAIENRVN